MALIKSSYPVTSTVAMTMTLASLASDTSLLAGQASTAVNNTTNLDLDHLVSGVITTGTSPQAGTPIEIWAYAARTIASNVPTYPDGITGTDAAKTMTSQNVKFSALRLLATITVDATSNRAYDFSPVSIAQVFGSLPPFWGLFVTNATTAALSSTGNTLAYERIQGQTV